MTAAPGPLLHKLPFTPLIQEPASALLYSNPPLPLAPNTGHTQLSFPFSTRQPKTPNAGLGCQHRDVSMSHTRVQLGIDWHPPGTTQPVLASGVQLPAVGCLATEA